MAGIQYQVAGRVDGQPDVFLAKNGGTSTRPDEAWRGGLAEATAEAKKLNAASSTAKATGFSAGPNWVVVAA
jgi:hypothetical protein